MLFHVAVPIRPSDIVFPKDFFQWLFERIALSYIPLQDLHSLSEIWAIPIQSTVNSYLQHPLAAFNDVVFHDVNTVNR